MSQIRSWRGFRQCSVFLSRKERVDLEEAVCPFAGMQGRAAQVGVVGVGCELCPVFQACVEGLFGVWWLNDHESVPTCDGGRESRKTERRAGISKTLKLCLLNPPWLPCSSPATIGRPTCAQFMRPHFHLQPAK